MLLLFRLGAFRNAYLAPFGRSGRMPGSLIQRRAVDGHVLLVLFASVFLASCGASSGSAGECVFPGPPRSAIAAGIPSPSDSTFTGSVIDIWMEPVEGAVVSLEPGGHRASTDSLGEFRFQQVPHGHYLMQAGMIGFAMASDSVTYGEFGITVVAVLAPATSGNFQCVRRLPRHSRVVEKQ